MEMSIILYNFASRMFFNRIDREDEKMDVRVCMGMLYADVQHFVVPGTKCICPDNT